MGLFSKARNTTETETGIWTKIENQEDLEKAEKDSFNQQIVIFKHSTRCPISRMVLKNFEKSIAENQLTENYRFYYLDLLRYRAISDEIEDHFKVVHQSPQILVIKDDHCTMSRSHTNILLSVLPK